MTAIFGALLCGILVNAIALQHGRHPAPLFGRRARASASRTLEPIPAPPPRPTSFASVPVAAPAPAETSNPTPAPRKEEARRARQDEIGALIGENVPHARRNEIGELIKESIPQGRHTERTVTAVQKALRKLGFQVKATGDLGVATRQALEKFERDRRLPISSELNPRVIHVLAARSGLSIPEE
jgi:hypothetical protein